MFLLIENFIKIIIDLYTVMKKYTEWSLVHFSKFFPNGNILYNITNSILQVAH